jgi:sugar phosphate isomerase/epimerase
MQRREFLNVTLPAALAAAQAAAAPRLKIGHRQANMVDKPGPEVFDFARRISGLSGVELQIQYKGTTLWDRPTAAAYKRAAAKTGLQVPSLAGIWKPGATILQPRAADEHLRKAVEAAEFFGAAVILVASFEDNCPDMSKESSYGPAVAVLQKVAPMAASAGVTLCMETSLSPADDAKLIDLVNRPSVRVYYDLDNCERFGHKGQAVPGLRTLGKGRIRQVHLKNEDRLLEQSGRVDWAAALKTLKATGYDGWLVFESSHSGPEQCIEATKKNIAFIERHWS